MKRFLLITIALLFVITLLVFSLKLFKNKVSSDLRQASKAVTPLLSPTPTPLLKTSERQITSIFVPYWALEHEGMLSDYNQLIYFGITPTQNGIDKEDIGYTNIESFMSNTSEFNGKKYVTLRMLDRKENFAIIENQKSRQRVIAETVQVANEYGFDGIVLDLEVTAIPFDSVIQNISTFVSELARETKGEGLGFEVAMYGDTYYRLRPFNVKKIGSEADRILIMAYDFHKAKGNPGPNFPLKGNEKFGYDMTKMIADFTTQIPPEKVSVIFGMFGYDWDVDEKGNAINLGKALGYIDIKKKFIDSCAYEKCEWKRDDVSGEINVTYLDEENQKHSIWFEDMQSTRIKQEFLKTRGISHFSYWAYSYF